MLNELRKLQEVVKEREEANEELLNENDRLRSQVSDRIVIKRLKFSIGVIHRINCLK